MIIDMTNNNMTLEEALFIAKPYDVIKLGNKVYFEKLVITTPHLTLIGDENTVIEYNAHNSMIIPFEMGGNGKKTFGTTGSSTLVIKEEAIGFTLKNLTVKNSHVRVIEESGGQAVAFKSETSNILLENCKFISCQDTLYIDYGFNNVVRNCYIEGDIDFIFGGADCVFYNCEIVAKNQKCLCYYTAPSTLAINDYGFIFYDCKFKASTEYTAFLGRRWFPGGATQPIFPKMSLINCNLNGNIDPELIQMHSKDPLFGELKIKNCYLNDSLIPDTGNVESELKLIK